MIPISRISLGSEVIQNLSKVIHSGWIAQGPYVAQFEDRFAEIVGAKHAVAVSSGTAALHLALLSCGIGPGDEVICPSLSFIATANAVRMVGAIPVFVDVDQKTFNLDPQHIVPAITSKTRAILPVHQLGLPAEMREICHIADQYGLQVIEDAACALGAMYHGERIGGSRRTCCFSFHPRKVITTGEGGMITTGCAEVADHVRSLRNHGQKGDRTLLNAQTNVASPAAHYKILGYNYRMTDIQAAIGLTQLESLPDYLIQRRQLALRYTDAFTRFSKIQTPFEARKGEHAFQSYLVMFQNADIRLAVEKALSEKEIATRPALTAIHQQPLYRVQASLPKSLPVTDAITQQGLMLPLYPGLKEQEQDQVIEGVINAVT